MSAVCYMGMGVLLGSLCSLRHIIMAQGSTPSVVATLLTLVLAFYSATAKTVPAPTIFAPAPAPGPHYANLTDLLSVAGPFHTFLNYLVQTKVIDTFQAQANNTDQGITIFVPKDSAFSAIKKPTFSNLTQDQLKSLLLLHAIPKYYSLSEFKNISGTGPVSTFGGSQYALNLTDAAGTIKINSDWANTKIVSSVVSTYPVAVYEVDKVLLPKAVFAVQPPLAPAPAPAPEKAAVPAADSPAVSKGVESPKGQDAKDSASDGTRMGYLSVVGAVGLMFMI